MIEMEIPISKIKIPEKHKRLVFDDTELKRSISTEGLKIPIAVVDDLKGSYILADGYRRLQIITDLSQDKVILAEVHSPKGDPEKYAGCLRVIVNHHRQDFFPSQRAHYLKILANKFNLSASEIAKSCGISRKTLESWLSVSDCIQEIKMFIDSGKFPLNAVQLITTLKREGQVIIIDKFRDYKKVTAKELRSTIEGIHRYHPDFIAKSLKVGIRTYSSKIHRSNVFGSNLNIVELEKKISDRTKEIDFMRREIIASKAIIRAILAEGKLRSMLLGDTLKKFDTFARED